MSYASAAQCAMRIEASGLRQAVEVAASAAGAFMGCAGVAAVLWVIVAAPGVLG